MSFVELNDVQLVAFADLAKDFPQIDWANEQCAFCGVKAAYMACGTISNEKCYADYEPSHKWRGVLFELRSRFGTNFEMAVCESHVYGMTE